ncbi:protein kinase domain-containing protein [Reticulomyxa filosa]|uniref:Protein kinase domain-containing protein n=1 Tax=Reticulomyxa filosa TaxID=46433 RepID=X6NQI9_RETFI|nr:protein kinase domain-containing protein [Reticulomyxa filosa]|eukprot:ETO27632.1 protein kinase domain-containing protein [Reticulomyxa filosa]
MIRSVRKYLDSARIETEILDEIAKKDENHKHHIIRFLGSFETKLNSQKHVCIIFEKMGCSLYQFVKKNDYRGFLIDHLRIIARQLFDAINCSVISFFVLFASVVMVPTFSFANVVYIYMYMRVCTNVLIVIHEELSLVHTDLKLENILLVDDSYITMNHPHFGQKYRVPNQTDIRLIDFGGAVFEKKDSKSHAKGLRFEIINTRQYRGPEVILGTGWDCSSDLWSIGCILSELYTGDLLFPTHENIEHLAMMEKVLEQNIPKHLIEKVFRLTSKRSSASHSRQVESKDSSSLSLLSSKRDPKRSLSSNVGNDDWIDDRFFDRETLRLRWPEIALSQSSIKHVNKGKLSKLNFSNTLFFINTVSL